MNKLPESLERQPNIPYNEQTLDQLRAEYEYWKVQVEKATGWGAGYSAALQFRSACKTWIERREKEQNS